MRSKYPLNARLARLKRLADRKLRDEQPVEFLTFWGDEPIPDDGSPVFVTDWGGGPLPEDDEDEAE